MAARREPPKRRDRSGGNDAGSGGASKGSGPGNPPQSGAPDPEEFRRLLRRGLNLVAQVLKCVEGIFLAATEGNGVARLRAEVEAQDSLGQTFAQSGGGMLVLFTVMDDVAGESQTQRRQMDHLVRLWNMTTILVNTFDQYECSAEKSGQLSLSYKLLADCANNGQEEDGLRAVRIAVETLEDHPTVRRIFLALHTKQPGTRPPQPPKAIRDMLHPLAALTAVIYTRIGFLHAYLQSGK